jgi:hypothetical protein
VCLGKPVPAAVFNYVATAHLGSWGAIET